MTKVQIGLVTELINLKELTPDTRAILFSLREILYGQQEILEEFRNKHGNGEDGSANEK